MELPASPPPPHPPKAGNSRFLSAFLIQCVHFWDAQRLRSHFLTFLPPSLGAFGVLLNQGWAPPAPLQESGAADKEEPGAGQRPPEQRLTLPQSGCAPPPQKLVSLRLIPQPFPVSAPWGSDPPRNGKYGPKPVAQGWEVPFNGPKALVGGGPLGFWGLSPPPQGGAG